MHAGQHSVIAAHVANTALIKAHFLSKLHVTKAAQKNKTTLTPVEADSSARCKGATTRKASDEPIEITVFSTATANIGVTAHHAVKTLASLRKQYTANKSNHADQEAPKKDW